MVTARWRILSSKVGIPIGRSCDPSPLGICTRRTGGAEYVPPSPDPAGTGGCSPGPRRTARLSVDPRRPPRAGARSLAPGRVGVRARPLGPYGDLLDYVIIAELVFYLFPVGGLSVPAPRTGKPPGRLGYPC